MASIAMRTEMLGKLYRIGAGDAPAAELWSL
jgi:hypothetical protein